MKTHSRNRKESFSGFSIFTGGLLSILVQAVVLREALFGRHQAELASGIVLAAWIIGAGLGAAAGGRASRHRLYWMAGIVILPILGFLQIAASRAGILPLAITVLPAGFAAGIVFIQPFAFERPGRIYAFEALGAAAGGAIFVLLSPYLLAGELLAVSIFFSIIGLLSCRSTLSALILAVVLFASQLFSIPEGFSRRLGSMAFGNYENVQVYPSPYGEVVTASRTGQYMVFRSGLLEATWPSLESAEETVTVPLAASLPSTVLYIGSSPEEAGIICSWPTVNRCVTVVLDRTLAEVIEYPGEIRIGDGRHYLTGDEFSYDLIIVSAGQPLTLLSNRYYTARFMKLLAGRLAPGGMAAIHLPGGINRLHPLEAELAHSVMLASESSFRWNRIIPVSGLMLMVGNGTEPSFEGAVLAERMDSLGVAGLYVNSGTLPSDLSAFRTAAFDDQIVSADAETNTDLHPEGFRIAHELWDFRMQEGEKVDLTIPAAGLFMLIMVVAAVLSGKPLTSLGVAAAGFTGLSVEVITLVSIQAATGYSWVLVGAVTGIFMTGGALGAFWTDKGIFKDPARIITLSGIAALFCAATLHLYSTGLFGGFFLTLCLLLGTFVCGVSCGGIFPSAAKVLGTGNTGRIGLLDLAEHGGSAAASLLMPLVLFPLLGAVKVLLIATAWVAIWTVVLRHR
ncbi:MAG: hypothetical protein GQ565_00075 [Candidatus Aegiribacteria sp.]|nr:hypothetical protein [Candidatus Aegiribacteria sp.]